MINVSILGHTTFIVFEFVVSFIVIISRGLMFLPRFELLPAPCRWSYFPFVRIEIPAAISFTVVCHKHT